MKLTLFALAALVTAPASAVTLNFDDLPGSSQITSYDGFDFGNMFVLDNAGYIPSGYLNAAVSGTHVAYNGYGLGATAVSATSTFSLTSGYFTAAWNDGLTVTATGTLAGSQVFSQSFVVNTQGPTLASFDPALIDKVVFTTSGGAHHLGYNGGLGTEFALDDLTINGTPSGGGGGGGGGAGTVPEPAAWALMVAGFGLVGGVLRRRVALPA